MSGIAEEIRKALDAATPGPWERLNPGSVIGHKNRAVVRQKGDFDWICSMQVSNCPNWDNDAHLIANAPTWLRWQQGEIERLTKENERLREECARYEYEIDGWKEAVGMARIQTENEFREELEQVKRERDDYRVGIEWYAFRQGDNGSKARSILSKYAREEESK